MAQALASLLECPICLDSFTDPRMLTTCCHSLCHKCLADHIEHSGQNGKFQCPVCRASLQVPENKADAFPKNYFINRCMDVVTDARTGARSKTKQAAVGRQRGGGGNECSNADDEDECAQPEQFCLDCCEYYCRNCSRVHRKLKATRSHVQVALDDLTEDMLREATSKSEAPRCQDHKEKMLELFCRTCQYAVCTICCHVHHRTHTLQDITKVDEDLKSELSKMLKVLQSLIDDSKEETVQIKQSEQRVERNISSAIETTKSIFQKMRNMLDQKDKQIVQKFRKMSKDTGANIAVQDKNQTLHTELLHSLHTFTDDLLKRGTVYNRLASLPDVRNRINEFQGSPLASADGATDTEIPDSADLVAKHLDGLVVKEEVNLSGPGSAAGLILEMKILCSIKQQTTTQRKVLKTQGATASRSEKPKLSVVMYYTPGYGSDWGRYLVNATVESLNTRLTCDVSYTYKTPLQPEVTDRPQVDVIDCWMDEIDSVVACYKITEATAGHRHLVLLHHSSGGSLTETRRALGHHVTLFKSIIWWEYGDDASRQAAKDSLADYFLQVGSPT